ncbi:MAG: clostripain-related cysteine peptidase [Candidatus Babeliales bacterium]|nr:clostripain-related cysteine peptidase [Candidatus Babeliales bacterium]
MKKVIIFILLFSAKMNGTLAFKPWLAFAYFAGHNDLYGFLQNTNFPQLPQGANSNVNIISSLNVFTGCPTPPSCSFVTTQRYITQPPPTGNVQMGPTIDGLNTSDQTTFINEITFAIQQAPNNNHFVIFLGGHGNGAANGCCLDQQNGAYLTDVGIQNGLKAAMQLRGGKKTDVLAIDCCYMACIEYYYAFANYTNFVIASEEEDPGNGLPYNLCLNLLKKNNIKTLDFAKGIVGAFNATYTVSAPGGTPFNHFTLAAIDSSKVVAICQNVNSIATIFLKLLNSSSKQTTLNLINKSISKITQFPDDQPNGIFVDLKSWYTNLVKAAGSNPIFKPVVAQIKTGINLITKAVVANGTNVPGASGMTIFMPLFPGKTCCKPTYAQTLFSQAFPNWLTFLTTVKNLQNT